MGGSSSIPIVHANFIPGKVEDVYKLGKTIGKYFIIFGGIIWRYRIESYVYVCHICCASEKTVYKLIHWRCGTDGFPTYQQLTVTVEMCLRVCVCACVCFK